MDLTEFRTKINILKEKDPEFQIIRVENAYTDFILLVNEFEKVKKVVLQDEITDQDDMDERERKYFRLKFTGTLLKAIHIFADIFISILLSEATKSRKISLNKFLEKPRNPLLNLSPNSILPAYCVVVYRNKVIVHHDFIHTDSFIFGGKQQEFRLLPFTEGFGVLPKDMKILDNLRNKYGDSIESLSDEQNYNEMLRILFYGIPIGELGKINNDRLVINRIASIGACKSLTCSEILSAIDGFTLAVSNSL